MTIPTINHPTIPKPRKTSPCATAIAKAKVGSSPPPTAREMVGERHRRVADARRKHFCHGYADWRITKRHREEWHQKQPYDLDLVESIRIAGDTESGLLDRLPQVTCELHLIKL